MPDIYHSKRRSCQRVSGFFEGHLAAFWAGHRVIKIGCQIIMAIAMNVEVGAELLEWSLHDPVVEVLLKGDMVLHRLVDDGGKT